MKRIYWSFFLIAFIAFSCGESKKKDKSADSSTQKETAPKPVKVKGQEVTYSTDSTTLKGYIAYDENKEGKRPGIIVVHEWWGHNDYVRKRADKLAEMGYTAIALDMYGDGKQAGHPADAGKFVQEVFSNMDEANARFTAALDLLKSNATVDSDKIGAIGYCFGGSVALTMANAGYDLDAVATFHSGLGLPIGPSKDLKAKILVCNGADDSFIPAKQVNAFKAMMDSVGADYKYISYPGVVHSFTSVDADSLGAQFKLPLAYNKEADENSWNEMKALFDSVF